MRAKPGLFLEY